jgi:hypothetical protein
LPRFISSGAPEEIRASVIDSIADEDSNIINGSYRPNSRHLVIKKHYSKRVAFLFRKISIISEIPHWPFSVSV